MLKPVLRTAFCVFAVISAVWFCYAYGVSVISMLFTVVAAAISAVEAWIDWLKPLRDKHEERRTQEFAKQQNDRFREELSQIAEQSSSFPDQLETAYASECNGVAQARKVVEQAIEEWCRETPNRLDALRRGWGARFSTIGKPTSHQCGIGQNRKHDLAGKLLLHREKLVEILRDLDK